MYKERQVAEVYVHAYVRTYVHEYIHMHNMVSMKCKHNRLVIVFLNREGKLSRVVEIGCPTDVDIKLKI